MTITIWLPVIHFVYKKENVLLKTGYAKTIIASSLKRAW